MYSYSCNFLKKAKNFFMNEVSNYQWFKIIKKSYKFISELEILENLLIKLLGKPFLPSPQDTGFWFANTLKLGCF